jgi:putative FmdB family regulatory protein
MPIFEYQCRECGERFERIVRFPREAATCKHCGSKRVEQLLSTFAVVERPATAPAEPSPCASCDARRRGLCGE